MGLGWVKVQDFKEINQILRLINRGFQGVDFIMTQKKGGRVELGFTSD